MIVFGATVTSLRISAAISPPTSAVPAPMRAIRVTASAPKPWKLVTNDVNRKRMPSRSSRLRMAIVVSLISYSTSSPA